MKTKENNQRRPNNSVVVRHSQGPLALSQELWIIFSAISCELSYRYTTSRLMIRLCPGHELPQFRDLAQRNGNKWSLELKTDCTWNTQAGQTISDQCEDDRQSWPCGFCMVAPSLLSTKLAPLVASGGGESAFGQMSATLPTSCQHLK